MRRGGDSVPGSAGGPPAVVGGSPANSLARADVYAAELFGAPPKRTGEPPVLPGTQTAIQDGRYC